MTDRVAGFVVTLKEDIRDDSIEHFLDLIAQMAVVAKIEPVISDPALHVAEVRARMRARDVLKRAMDELG